jgi:tRNA A-37 threonylcarbamoyl transferase component Bud32
LAVPINPSSPDSPVPHAKYGATQDASATSSTESSGTSLSRKRGADLQWAPLQIGRRTGDKTDDGGVRFNADLAAFGGPEPPAGGSGITPGSAPPLSRKFNRSMTIPDLLRRTVSTPVTRREHSEPGNASRILKEEREYKSSLGEKWPSETISPHLAAIICANSSNQTLVSTIAAMKPGREEIRNGFISVQLARSFDTVSSDKPAKKQLGIGKYGVAYEVRLSENFFRKKQDLGRDFVFKAMLCMDRENPLPPDLYGRLRGDQAPDALAREVTEERERIFSEFQIAASLAHTSRVMQVHGLVQIGDQLGILAEKIEGATARELLAKSIQGLGNGAISPAEHLSFAGQVVADILVGISRFVDEGVTHLDISPNNVLYDKKEKHFKLIDMGKGREEGKAKEPGTNGYFDMCMSAADQRSDVYSAGQLLAHLLKDPAYEVGVTGFFGKKTVDKFPFMSALATGLPLEYKEKMMNLINWMTAYPAVERPTAQEVLRDPFLMNLAPPDQIHAYYEKLNKLPGN